MAGGAARGEEGVTSTAVEAGTVAGAQARAEEGASGGASAQKKKKKKSKEKAAEKAAYAAKGKAKVAEEKKPVPEPEGGLVAVEKLTEEQQLALATKRSLKETRGRPAAKRDTADVARLAANQPLPGAWPQDWVDRLVNQPVDPALAAAVNNSGIAWDPTAESALSRDVALTALQRWWTRPEPRAEMGPGQVRRPTFRFVQESLDIIQLLDHLGRRGEEYLRLPQRWRHNFAASIGRFFPGVAPPDAAGQPNPWASTIALGPSVDERGAPLFGGVDTGLPAGEEGSSAARVEPAELPSGQTPLVELGDLPLATAVTEADIPTITAVGRNIRPGERVETARVIGPVVARPGEAVVASLVTGGEATTTVRAAPPTGGLGAEARERSPTQAEPPRQRVRRSPTPPAAVAAAQPSDVVAPAQEGPAVPTVKDALVEYGRHVAAQLGFVPPADPEQLGVVQWMRAHYPHGLAQPAAAGAADQQGRAGGGPGPNDGGSRGRGAGGGHGPTSPPAPRPPPPLPEGEGGARGPASGQPSAVTPPAARASQPGPGPRGGPTAAQAAAQSRVMGPPTHQPTSAAVQARLTLVAWTEEGGAMAEAARGVRRDVNRVLEDLAAGGRQESLAESDAALVAAVGAVAPGGDYSLAYPVARRAALEERSRVEQARRQQPPPAQMAEFPIALALHAHRVQHTAAFGGDRRAEQVLAPAIDTRRRAVWVNGKPLRGRAILDTGAMPLLIGRAGMKQLGWGPADTVPNAIKLGLADGKSSHAFPLTKEPVKFTFNPGTPAETSIHVRAVVTDAPYDFLIGNILMWTMGMVIDSWQEQVRYRVGWKNGRNGAGGEEGVFPVRYERERRSGPLPTAFMAGLEGDGAVPEVLRPNTPGTATGERFTGCERGPRRPPTLQEWGRVWGARRFAAGTGAINTGDDGPITVLSLFAGVGAELEALLRAGARVRKYLWVENDPVARKVMRERLEALSQRFPEGLPELAYRAGLDARLPEDVQDVTGAELILQGHIDLVTVSSPCQGLSRANRVAAGMEDKRSALVGEAWRILAELAQCQLVPPGYIFEMVDASEHPNAPAREAYRLMEEYLGGPGSWVKVDAAKTGSPAHRIRVFGTNLAPPQYLRDRYELLRREDFSDRREAQDVLGSGRQVQDLKKGEPDIPGIFKVNEKGKPLRIFPTLVSRAQSYAWRDHGGGVRGIGMIYDFNRRAWDEPNAVERERIMGMLPNSTTAPEVTEEERRALIGQAVDVRAYRWLFKEISRWRRLEHLP